MLLAVHEYHGMIYRIGISELKARSRSNGGFIVTLPDSTMRSVYKPEPIATIVLL